MLLLTGPTLEPGTTLALGPVENLQSASTRDDAGDEWVVDANSGAFK
ncbi:hypothetical protein [Demequina sp.]|nr:hypothetical protein [Demequina sp.]